MIPGRTSKNLPGDLMFILNDREFNLLSRLVYDNIGIKLGPAKKELLRTRLSKRLRALEISSFREYYKYATRENHKELNHLFDAISTNLTSFFREEQHFDFIVRHVLPGLIKERRKEKKLKLRIWSAACSTGEEAYSLAVMLSEFLDDISLWDIKILATDINTEVLAHAERGIYTEEKTKKISKKILKTYFLRGYGKKEGLVKVKKNLRDMIVFRRLNLKLPVYPFSNGFDFIFCRNVMIYFDKETQKNIIHNVYKHLRSGGYLFLGHAESLTGLSTPLVYIKPTIYMKR